jgi:hypothetical protein
VRLVRAPPLGKVETRDGLIRLFQTHPFLRADANLDGVVDISDPVGTLAVLFQGAGDQFCADAADSNDDGAVDITDSIYTLSFLFTGGPPSRPPSPDSGLDPTPDKLGCDGFPCRREKLAFEDKPEVPWDFVEFCIPDQEEFRQQVLDVYPEVRFLPDSAGRIGCGAEDLLCVIDWFALDHWKVCELSVLPFVGEIRGSYFE